MYDEEEIIREWERQGGGFLIKNGIIDTSDIEEVKRFRRRIEEEKEEEEEEEIEKIGYENGLKEKFSFVKENERSDEKMSYIFDDSANNVTDDEELRDLIEEFNGEKIDKELEKALKVISEKLRSALKESFKILNEYKSEISDIPDLFAAIKLLGKLATAGKAGKYPYPEKYPYPKKVKKSMSWSKVQDLLFGGHIGPADDDEIEKSSKSNPFPSIVRAIKIKEEAIDEVEDELEENSFDPDDRRI